MARVAAGALVLAAACVLAGPAPSLGATSYCSPETGDFCVGAVKIGGVRTILVRSFAHRGLIRVCITHAGFRDCRRFRLAPDPKEPSIYQFERRWSRHFPHRGPGRYDVRFSQGYQLGPTLSFPVA
jgi:hypothetical protein